MTKTIVVFRKFANAPKNTTQCITKYSASRSEQQFETIQAQTSDTSILQLQFRSTYIYVLACHYYNNAVLHSMKTVATFPVLLALVLVKPVCLSPRPFSFSPLSQHSLLQFMSLSLSCSYSVLHFSPLTKHEKRPYWFKMRNTS